HDDERCPDVTTSGFPSEALAYLARLPYEEILALVHRPPQEVSLGKDQTAEALSRSIFGRVDVETQPPLDRTPLKNGSPKLQQDHAGLVMLVHLYLYTMHLQPNHRVVVPTSIARHLARVSQRLRLAPVLVYAFTDLWKFRIEGDGSFTLNGMGSDLAEEMPDLLSRASSQAPRPVPQPPNAGALYETYFIPAGPYLLGCIEEPKGRPCCTGGYSDVWRSNIRFSIPSEALPTEVAVKILRSVWLSNRNEADANERMLRRFMQEVITWLGLPQHPNIVPLIGWTLTPSLSFISPWYKQGNLYGHLKNLSDTQRIHVLLGIAKGLECLHSRTPPVAHGDLKPENILMSDSGDPLLADFGGSFPWMSPEQMIEGSRSCQSDIYSFGSLAFTIMTGELPHAGLTDGQIAFKVCNRKDPKDPVEDWSKYPRLQGPIKDLLSDCWSRSPNARPSMTATVQRLTPLLESSKLSWTTMA
ncbi:hypothetical protein FRC01_004583, partial [Tulasnella sp. 417]